MKGVGTPARRIRRVGVAIGVVTLFAAVGAPSALADTGLPGDAASHLTGSAPETLTSPVAEFADPATAVVTSVEETAAAVVSPVVDAAPPAVGSLPEPAPTVQQAVETTRSAVETHGPAVRDAAPPPSSPAPHGDAAATETKTTAAQPLSASAPLDSTVAAPPTRRAGRTPPGAADDPLPRRLPFAAVENLTSAPVTGVRISANGDGATPSSRPQAPVPSKPSGPLPSRITASASAGGGALVSLLAALAAALFLAVPGLGRRLRPRLAPRPRPIPHLLLERPG